MTKVERGVAARHKTSKRRSPIVILKKTAKVHDPSWGNKRDETPRRAKLVDKDHTQAMMEVLLKSSGVADTTELNLPQAKLQEMSLPKRIAAVAADVRLKTGRLPIN